MSAKNSKTTEMTDNAEVQPTHEQIAMKVRELFKTSLPTKASKPFGLARDLNDTEIKRDSVEQIFTRENLPSRYTSDKRTVQTLITVEHDGKTYNGLAEFTVHAENTTNKIWLGAITVYQHSEKIHDQRTESWNRKLARMTEKKRADMPAENPALRVFNTQKFVLSDSQDSPLTIDGHAFNANKLEFEASKWSIYTSAIMAQIENWIVVK